MRMMTQDTIKQRLTQFVTNYVRRDELEADEDIFATGLVNSLFAMQLVMFIEKEFNIQVENEDLELDNFRTINSMAGLVARKTG